MVRMLTQTRASGPVIDGLLALQLTGNPVSALVALAGPLFLRAGARILHR
ncbi:MAG TPA: hypothetical protein VKQ09_05300 [Sphingomonas sp.]|nr:hypothetical protein [Sphingomonas sp.]